MMYLVTAIRDIYSEGKGVEVAGIFDTEEKAYSAKAAVEKWMQDDEYEDYEIFVSPIEVNYLSWYEIEKYI